VGNHCTYSDDDDADDELTMTTRTTKVLDLLYPNVGLRSLSCPEFGKSSAETSAEFVGTWAITVLTAITTTQTTRRQERRDDENGEDDENFGLTVAKCRSSSCAEFGLSAAGEMSGNLAKVRPTKVR
jgi:hypothetical protein